MPRPSAYELGIAVQRLRGNSSGWLEVAPNGRVHFVSRVSRRGDFLNVGNLAEEILTLPGLFLNNRLDLVRLILDNARSAYENAEALITEKEERITELEARIAELEGRHLSPELGGNR